MLATARKRAGWAAHARTRNPEFSLTPEDCEFQSGGWWFIGEPTGREPVQADRVYCRRRSCIRRDQASDSPRSVDGHGEGN
jgi:hypothetical protein